MIQLVLKRAIDEYRDNIKVMLSFGVLFLFVALFVFFEQFFVSSGTVFFLFNESLLAVVGLIFGLVFLYVFSFFVSLTVYSVKRDMQRISLDVYWNTLMKKASLKIFLFYLAMTLFVYIVSFMGLFFGYSVIAGIICFIIILLLIYVPQSIVLDELSIKDSIYESIVFWLKNPIVSIAIIFIGAIILTIILAIEFALELLSLPGIVVSFVLVLIFLVPFLEQMKSYAFILKFDLIKQPEIQRSKMVYTKPVKIDAIRLREKPKSGSKI